MRVMTLGRRRTASPYLKKPEAATRTSEQPCINRSYLGQVTATVETPQVLRPAMDALHMRCQEGLSERRAFEIWRKNRRKEREGRTSNVRRSAWCLQWLPVVVSRNFREISRMLRDISNSVHYLIMLRSKVSSPCASDQLLLGFFSCAYATNASRYPRSMQVGRIF